MIIPTPIYTPIPINNTTSIESCFSRKENLDLAQKYNLHQEFTNEEQARLESCVEDVEEDVEKTNIYLVAGLIIFLVVWVIVIIIISNL